MKSHKLTTSTPQLWGNYQLSELFRAITKSRLVGDPRHYSVATCLEWILREPVKYNTR